MTKPEIAPEQKKMLDELAKSLPLLVKDVQERLQAINAVNQKIAAHISMLQAYRWPVPPLEGITIQTSQLSPEDAKALLSAHQSASASTTPTPVVVQTSTATAVTKPERA